MQKNIIKLSIISLIIFIIGVFFIGLKKAEYAMVSNLIRNFAIPVIVYYMAVKMTVSLNTFFWLWSLSNIIYSALILLFVIFFIKNQQKYIIDLTEKIF